MKKKNADVKTLNSTNRESMIKIKGGYSERSGEIRFETTLQVMDFDDRTRTVLNNGLFEIVKDTLEKDNRQTQTGQNFCKVIRSDVFGKSTRLQNGHIFNWGVEYNQIDEAKYMLVTCSAFLNYLIAKYEKYADTVSLPY